MKRSKHVKLTLMASTALALSACGDDTETVENFTSVDACEASGTYTAEQCQTAYEKAVEVHQQSAPRYNSRNLCYQEFGTQCEYHQHGSSSFWTPFMAGYLVSSLINDNRSSNYYTPYYARYGSNRGLYTWSGSQVYASRNSQGKYETSVSRKAMTAKPKPARVMTRTSVISKGGFGSKSRSSSRSRSRSWGG